MLNRPESAGATILVAGPEFGTGSSREHAVWALQNYGFRVVISLAVRRHLPRQCGQGWSGGQRSTQPEIEALWAAVDADPTTAVTVDLESRTVSWGTTSVGFEIDDYTRWRLLEGLDDIDLTLRHADEITQFEQRRPAWMPATG